MEIYASYPPITDEDLTAFENIIGATLPAMYREFLKNHNGGAVRPSRFQYIDNGWQELGGVNRFYSITDKSDRYSLTRVWHVYRTRLPERMLAIANDGVGNNICISVSGDDVGKIYYWMHEIPSENEENLFLIADDLETFLAGLSTYNESED